MQKILGDLREMSFVPYVILFGDDQLPGITNRFDIHPRMRLAQSSHRPAHNSLEFSGRHLRVVLYVKCWAIGLLRPLADSQDRAGADDPRVISIGSSGRRLEMPESPDSGVNATHRVVHLSVLENIQRPAGIDLRLQVVR